MNQFHDFKWQIFEKNFVDKSKNKLFISTVWIFFTQYNVCKYTRLVTVSLNKFKCYKLQCSLYIIIQRLQSKTLFSPNGATFQNTYWKNHVHHFIQRINMKKKTNSNQLKGLVICDQLLNLILCMVYIVSYTRVITLHGNVTD